jgi:eukaryotic-like serine/threonine-protein kinase
MSEMLRPGQIVKTESLGKACQVEEFLGGGGQGEVYRANFSGRPVALKWYFPSTATPTQRMALETLIKKGPPNEKFLWPVELASAPNIPGYGYIMLLREQRFKSIVDLMRRRVEPTFRVLATAGLELSNSFLQLHSKGLCYCDISFGNVFFDPENGDIAICDNDNVAVDGETEGGIKGTPRFMAPEVVCNIAWPSTQTDLFSLAVLLFYIFMLHHPLEGRKESSIKCFDLPAMVLIYGLEPVFIFDPDNDSNRPDPRYHETALNFWPIYPQFLRDLFIRAFTKGIKDPGNGRIREGEWRAAMVQLRDQIIYCGSCGVENFYDVDALRATGGKPSSCWSCKKELFLPARIRIGKNIVMLNYDTRLFPHHVDGQKMYDFSRPVAEVAHHPSNPNIWGLRNLSNERWICTTADGARKDVEPGRSVTISLGTKINFGNREGEIRI